MKYPFSKKERLKSGIIFKNVFEKGENFKSRFITVYVQRTKEEERKAGFAVSSKIRSSCLRNRIKRMLRETYRLNLNKLKKGFYIVILGRNGIEKLKFKEIENILLDLLKSAKILFCFFLIIFSFPVFLYATDTVTIAGVGDVYLGDKLKEFINKYGMDYPFKKVKNVLDAADLVVANLEAPFTSSKKKYTTKTYYLKSIPAYVESLKLSGIDIVTLANNHIMDYGKEGLINTINVLKKANIGYVGAGLSITEASKPYIIEVNGIKCAFLSFGAIYPTKFYANRKKPGIAPSDESFLIETISGAKKNADLIVVSFHWGKELEVQPDYYQVHLAHTAIESGANLVLGHHPHVLQGIEYYLNGAICYSLGNFVFASLSEKVKRSIILHATFEKNEGQIFLSKLRITPISVDNKKELFQPRILKDKDAKDALEEISKLIKTRGTNLHVEADIGILEPMPEKEKFQAIAQSYFKSSKTSGDIPSETTITVKSKRDKYHIVKKGETLSSIAKKYKVKVLYLKKINNIKSSLIYPKQVIIVRRTQKQKITIKPEPMPLINLEEEALDETSKSVIEAALEYLGLPYRFGGEGKRAIDCSALIQKAFKSNNISLPRTAKGQFEAGEVVKELKPGDLLFFATRALYATHVGMYLGNNEFIHASRENGVCVTNVFNPYYASRFIGAKRVLNGKEDKETLEVETNE